MLWTYPVAGISEYLFHKQSEESELSAIEPKPLESTEDLEVLVELGESKETPLVHFGVLASVELMGQTFQVDIL